MRLSLPVTLLLLAVPATPAPGQEPVPLDALSRRLAAMTAVSGYEQRMVDTLVTMLPGSRRDRAGNLVLTLGSGEPRSLIACPMDEPGYVIGGVRPDGYLTLRRVGRPRGALADQQLEGQRVTLWGRKGPVPGVVGVRSIHLTNGRPPLPDTPFGVDDAIVDIGADNAATVASLGVGVLTPVALTKRPFTYADSLLAGVSVGRRTACAALVRAALTTSPARGTVVVAFVVEQLFTQRGLLTVARNLGPFDDALLLDIGAAGSRVGARVSPDSAALRSFETWLLPVRHAGTAVETVSLSEAAVLERGLTFRIRGGE